jgi:hypothetical protein
MLKSVIIRLAGGIGNQLFQTAFGLSLAQKFSATAFLNTDNFTNDGYHREPEILKLDFDQSILSESKPVFEAESTLLLREGTVSSLEEIVSLPTNCRTLIIDGYWQSESFLAPPIIDYIYRKLCEKFETSDQSLGGDTCLVESSRIAIHIRRRDYAHMGVTRNEYYAACLGFVREHTHNSSLALYSDEPNASHHLLLALGYRDVGIVRSGDDWKDLYSLSRHKYILMANSTYSWWGARFGEELQGKVIFRPAPWLTFNNTTDPCPTRWISVPNSVVSGIGVSAEISVSLYNSIKSSIFHSIHRTS